MALNNQEDRNHNDLEHAQPKVIPDKRSIFQQWSQETTFHGFLYVLEGQTITEKILWSVVIIVATVLAAYKSYTLCKQYSDQVVGTQVEMMGLRDRANLMEIFHLVYCPQDWMNLSKVKESFETKTITMNSLLFGLSLIPELDPFIVEQLYTRFKVNKTDQLLQINGGSSYLERKTVHFADWADIPEVSRKFVETFRQNQSATTLMDFFLPLVEKMHYKQTQLERLIFRFGRVCQQVHLLPESTDSGNQTAFEEIHTNILRFTFKHYYRPAEPTYPKIQISPYTGQLASKISTCMSMNRISGLLTELEIRERDILWSVTYPIIIDHAYNIEANQYVRANRDSARCSESSDINNRVPSGYSITGCEELCLQMERRDQFKTIFDCDYVTATEQMITETPCNDATILISGRDSDGSAFPPSLAYRNACRRKCQDHTDCNEFNYRLQITAPSEDDGLLGDAMTTESSVSDEFPHEYFHVVEFHVSNLLAIREYKIMSITELLGNVGGIVGLLLGASVLTLIHTVVFVLKTSIDLCKKAILKQQRKLADSSNEMNAIPTVTGSKLFKWDKHMRRRSWENTVQKQINTDSLSVIDEEV